MVPWNLQSKQGEKYKNSKIQLIREKLIRSDFFTKKFKCDFASRKGLEVIGIHISWPIQPDVFKSLADIQFPRALGAGVGRLIGSRVRRLVVAEHAKSCSGIEHTHKHTIK